MSTLGLGDVYPIDPWLRVFAPVQALIGFALLTAAVAWFLELYPGLGRRRALALRIALMHQADTAGHLLAWNRRPRALCSTRSPATSPNPGRPVAERPSYYFTEDNAAASLAAQLPYGLHLAKPARRASDRTVRISGQMLEEAIDDFAGVLLHRFIPAGDDTDAILREYARQHRQRPAVTGETTESLRRVSVVDRCDERIPYGCIRFRPGGGSRW